MTDKSQARGLRDEVPPQRMRRSGYLRGIWRKVRRPLAESAWLKHAIAWLIHGFLRSAYDTNRWAEGSHDIERDLVPLRGSIFVMWHGQHLLMPTIRPKNQPVAAMFSRSNDAEINAILARTFGIVPVRGSGGDPKRQSASKGGATALMTLRGHLADDTTVFMVADNRHAPRSATLGSLMLSRISGRPIYPIAIATSRRKVLRRTWDGTTINLPFGRKCLIIGKPVRAFTDMSDDEMEGLRLALTENLDAATAEAYRIVDRSR